MSATRRPRAAGGIALLALLIAWAVPAGGAADDSPQRYAGKRLEQALSDLRSGGLKIVFSSNVVRPRMRVATEPTASDPRLVLEQLLAPHGLAVQDGPGGTVVVVPRSAARVEETALVSGVVQAADDGTPLGGASVRIVESGALVATGSDGRFAILAETSGPVVLEAWSDGFLGQRLEGVASPGEAGDELIIRLVRIPVIEEQLIVHPSRLSLLRETPAAPLSLSRDEIGSLPHLGGDFYRALTLLPGASGNDVSAQFHVRGGRRDETQILIDGQELYDAFHLKDRDSAVSLISPQTIGGADLNTGGFTAEYGDRMSGVLDMTTVRPARPRTFRVGIGVVSASAGGSGVLAGDRGSWVVELRRGATDLVGRLLGDEDPEFWDAFGKLEYRLGQRHTLGMRLLASGDELRFEEVLDDERKRFETDYASSYVWLTHQTVLGSDAVLDTAVSFTNIDRDRRGVELEEGAQFDILDERETEIFGLRQSWDYLATRRQTVEFGWQLRDFETEYRYTGTREFDSPLARIRHDYGEDLTDLREAFDDRHGAVYLADQMTLAEDLAMELGLRFDDHSLVDGSFVSPRFNLAYALGGDALLRAAWGRFNQSQRTYELGVEDGERRFHPVERSEHRVLGFETVLRRRAAGAGTALRLELYQREVGNPRPRYVNLFEPLNTFPEVEPDRVLIVPERSLAEGVEIFLRSGFGEKVGWWINYAYAATEDRVEGLWVPRLFDQRHALNLDLDFEPGRAWRLNLAWRFHTGWPTTAVSVRRQLDDEGEAEFVPILGPLNAERLPDYHRLDLRARRRWEVRWGAVDVFVDIQNLYDRQNVGGFDIEIDDDDGSLARLEEAWAGLLPSAGISLQF